MSDSGFACPRCGTFVAVDGGSVVTAIEFPVDDEYIVDLLLAELNVIVCPVCHARTTLVPYMEVSWVDEMRYILLRPQGVPDAEASLIDAFRSQGGSATLVTDLPSLRQELYRWLVDYDNPRLKLIHDPKRFQALSPSDRIDIISPLLLRAWRAGFDGLLPIDFAGDPDPETREMIFSIVVADHIREFARWLASEGRVGELGPSLGRAIPTPCLTPGVLDDLQANRRRPVEGFADAASFDGAFLDMLTWTHCALRAGALDQVGDQVARYVLTAADYFPDPAEGSMLAAMLAPQVVRPVLTFDAIWSLARQSVGHGGMHLFSDVVDRYGYAAEYSTALFTISFSGVGEDAAARMYVGLREALAERYRTPLSPDDLEEASAQVSYAVRLIFSASGIATAEKLAYEVLEHFRHDPAAPVAVAAEVAHEFQNVGQFDAARRVLESVDAWVVNANLPPTVISFYARTYGRLAGHQQKYESALVMLDLARTAAGDDIERIAGIDHTRSVVLRDAGRYSEALALLEGLVRHAESPHYLLTLARTLLTIGRVDEAVHTLTTALAVDAAPGIDTVHILMSRSQAWQILCDHDRAVDDLQRALRIATAEHVDGLARDVEAQCLYLRPSSPAGAAFVAACRSSAHNLLTRPIDVRDAATPVLALTAALDDYLEARDFDGAYSLLSQHEAIFDWSGVTFPWELHYAAARVYGSHRDTENRRRHCRIAAEQLSKTLPTGDDGAHAITWLRGKDDFQTFLVDTTVDDVRAGDAGPEELLWAYELGNGIEIAARSRRSGLDVEALVEVAIRPDAPADVIFFLDGTKEVHVARIGREGDVKLADVTIRVDAARRASQEFREALRRTNPADLDRLTGRTPLWVELAARLGEALRPDDGARVVFLAGRHLSGLPLHLLPVGDSRVLLDIAEISYCPNFSTLVQSPTSTNEDAALLVAVPKESDTDDFRARLATAGADITRRLERLCGTVRQLDGIEATVETVVDAIGQADTVVMLCHGTRASRGAGYGICVGSDGRLPPHLLPVVEVPAMEEFILTWVDLTATQSAPALFVSIACSSGQIVVGSGGTRLGLEQALLGNGGTAIISPLWDVDQAAALAWVDEFLRLRTEARLPVPAAYRQASLTLRDHYDHFYQWGAFSLVGRLYDWGANDQLS